MFFLKIDQNDMFDRKWLEMTCFVKKWRQRPILTQKLVFWPQKHILKLYLKSPCTPFLAEGLYLEKRLVASLYFKYPFDNFRIWDVVISTVADSFAGMFARFISKISSWEMSLSTRAVIHPKFFKVGVGRVGRWRVGPPRWGVFWRVVNWKIWLENGYFFQFLEFLRVKIHWESEIVVFTSFELYCDRNTKFYRLFFENI